MQKQEESRAADHTALEYDAVIKAISVKTGKDGESLATLKIEIESFNPRLEFAGLLEMQRKHCRVTIESSGHKVAGD